MAPADVAGNRKRFLETKPSSKTYALFARATTKSKNVQNFLKICAALIKINDDAADDATGM